ncbi:MAG: hypothetical protein H0T57_15955 [Rubrobacter sp.]|nr:hypothetical protein [Rubrobacter sp.]
MLDPVAVERVESEIDKFVSKRAQEKRDANAIEELWTISERKDRERRRRENRAAWYAFEVHMSELHASLSKEHRSKAEGLLEEPGGGGGR